MKTVADPEVLRSLISRLGSLTENERWRVVKPGDHRLHPLAAGAIMKGARRCEVTARSLTHAESRQSPAHRVSRNGLLQLGWFHFWLLAAILGGMIGLVALVFFARFVSL
jgi:hypothetical protein